MNQHDIHKNIRISKVLVITDPKAIIANNLRTLRTSAGLSQEELADRAGLHRTYVSSVEGGKRNVTLENIFSLAKALGATPADLVRLPKAGKG